MCTRHVHEACARGVGGSFVARAKAAREGDEKRTPWHTSSLHLCRSGAPRLRCHTLHGPQGWTPNPTRRWRTSAAPRCEAPPRTDRTTPHHHAQDASCEGPSEAPSWSAFGASAPFRPLESSPPPPRAASASHVPDAAERRSAKEMTMGSGDGRWANKESGTRAARGRIRGRK